MTQAEGVSHLVCCHEACSIIDESVGNLRLSHSRVDSSGLHLQPACEQRAHVVPPDDVGFEYLAASRVYDTGSHGIGLFGCGVCEHGVLHVIVLTLYAVCHVGSHDGIFKSCLLKGYLPVFYALAYGRLDGRWYALVEVEDDGLDRFHEFAPHVCLFVFGFESPAVDEVLGLDVLLVVGVAEAALCEVAHSLVLLSSLHGGLVEQIDGRGDDNGDVDFLCAFIHLYCLFAQGCHAAWV